MNGWKEGTVVLIKHKHVIANLMFTWLACFALTEAWNCHLTLSVLSQQGRWRTDCPTVRGGRRPGCEEDDGLGWGSVWVHEVNLYFSTSRRITLLQPNSGHQFCQIRSTRTCPPVSVPIHRPFINCFMALNGTTFIICQVTDHVGLMGPPSHTVGVHFSVLQTRAQVHLQLAGRTFH